MRLPIYERRSLDHFSNRTLEHVQGPFRSKFWSTVVPVLVQQDSIVRHAVCALSTIHEQYLNAGPADQACIQYAIHYQQKAVREIVRLDEPTFESLLSASVIFYSYASLFGEFDEATRHAVAGLKMVANQPAVRPSSSIITDEILLHIFLELRDQLCLANSEQFKMESITLSDRLKTMPCSLRTFEDILHHVQVLSFQVLDLFEFAETHHATEPWVRGSVSPILQPAYAAVVSKLAELRVALDAVEKLSKHQKEAYTTLRIFMISLNIDIQVFLYGEEAYDNFVDDNMMILELVEVLFSQQNGARRRTPGICPDGLSSMPELGPGGSNISTPSSSLPSCTKPMQANAFPSMPGSSPQLSSYVSALGIIPLLFEVATRTENNLLRDHALHILRHANRRDGIWDSRVTCILAERLIELTQQGNSIAKGSPTGGVCDTIDVLPSPSLESQDIRRSNNKFIITDIQILSDKRCKVTYGFKRRWTNINHDPGKELHDIGSEHEDTAREEFHSFWLEGVAPGEGELAEMIIDID